MNDCGPPCQHLFFNSSKKKENIPFINLQGHPNSVYSVAFSADGEHVVSGGDDKTVRIWSTTTGTLEQTLKGHTSYVWSVAFSPDGEHVVSGSSDSTVRIWAVGNVALFVKNKLDGSNFQKDEDACNQASEHLGSLYGEVFRTLHEQVWTYINRYRPDLRGNMFSVDRAIESHIMKEQVEHDWNELQSHLHDC